MPRRLSGHSRPSPQPSRDRSRSRGARATNSRARLEALRAASETASPDRLFLATLRIGIPSTLWTGPFSRSHPTVRLEVLNQGEVTPETSVSDYWISGTPPGVWGSEIAGFPDVIKVESLAEVGEGSLYRVTYRNPPVIYLYRRLRLPLQFPLWIQAGKIRWEVVARYSELQTIVNYARQADPGMQIVSIRRGPLRSHLPLLTEAQQKLLGEAMAAGYFAVPRGITLTGLARKLDRSKSSISEAIALIEQKLLETAVRPSIGPV